MRILQLAHVLDVVVARALATPHSQLASRQPVVPIPAPTPPPKPMR